VSTLARLAAVCDANLGEASAINDPASRVGGVIASWLFVSDDRAGAVPIIVSGNAEVAA
jgi:hypothetical protein